MAADEMLVLGRDELQSLGLTWTDVVDVLEDAFRQKAAGLVQNPPKPAVRPRKDAFINAMPAYLGRSDRVGIKWVAGFEQNRAKDCRTSMGWSCSAMPRPGGRLRSSTEAGSPRCARPASQAS